MKRPIQGKVLVLLAFYVFQVSCEDPGDSSVERGDATTSSHDDESSINRQEKSEEPLQTQTQKSFEEAVVEGDLEVVRKYIAAGADLNRAVAENGSTGLMTTVTFDHTEISLLLIESGADLEVKINDGSTVLLAVYET